MLWALPTGEELFPTPPIRVSCRRESGIWRQFLSPSETPLAASGPIRRMEIGYPPRSFEIGLREVHWFLAAVVLMMAFSLLLGYAFGVRIV